MLTGWQRYRHHPDPCVRSRIDREVDPLRTTYAAALWGMRASYRRGSRMWGKLNALLEDLYRIFGWRTRIYAALAGPYVAWAIKREQRRLARGWTCEPATLYQRNAAARSLAEAQADEEATATSANTGPHYIHATRAEARLA